MRDGAAEGVEELVVAQLRARRRTAASTTPRVRAEMAEGETAAEDRTAAVVRAADGSDSGRRKITICAGGGVHMAQPHCHNDVGEGRRADDRQAQRRGVARREDRVAAR
eukprot:gene14947-biopygen11766